MKPRRKPRRHWLLLVSLAPLLLCLLLLFGEKRAGRPHLLDVLT